MQGLGPGQPDTSCRPSQPSPMCSRGVWQLRQLTLVYSPKHPTSLGVRQWIESPKFAQFVADNPHLKVNQYPKHVVSPFLQGDYSKFNFYFYRVICPSASRFSFFFFWEGFIKPTYSFLLPLHSVSAVDDSVKRIPVKQADAKDVEKLVYKLRNEKFRSRRLKKWFVFV